ncbi:hypothetical protein B0G81_7492 [Paraburkholderia sp. BL6665CI2N2]|nr:hypothetical protein B0G81_7492 [Paraburkholderia sp. BL6665CI2N2]
MKPSVDPARTLVTTLINAHPETVDGAIGPINAATQHAPLISTAAASV